MARYTSFVGRIALALSLLLTLSSAASAAPLNSGYIFAVANQGGADLFYRMTVRWEANDAGGGLTRYDVFLDDPRDEQRSYALDAFAFTGAINQDKAFGNSIVVNDQERAVLFDDPPNYDAGLDSFFFPPFTTNTYVTGITDSLGGTEGALQRTYNIQAGTGGGSKLDSVQVAQIVAAGNVDLAAKIGRAGYLFIGQGTLSFAPTTSQKVFLDWFSSMSRNYHDPGPVNNYSDSPGPTLFSQADISGAYRQEVQAEVAAIFDESGLGAIQFVDQPDPDAVVVRFSPSIPDQPGTRGIAFDIGVRGGGSDRFNERLDGEVGIFVNPSVQSAELVGEVVAHEIGHALGLRHVNPAGSVEVMDYDATAGERERFTNGNYNIVEGPNLDSPLDQFGVPYGTHNPLYHALRYTLGMTDESLQAQGILPGTWDLESLQNHRLIEFVYPSGSLYDLTLQTLSSDGQWINELWLGSVVVGFPGSILLRVEPNDVIRFVASSKWRSPSEPFVLDTILVPTGATVDDPSMSALPLGSFSGTVYTYSEDLGDFVPQGEYYGTVIPEPSTGILLLLGVTILVVGRRRILGARRKPAQAVGPAPGLRLGR